MLGPLEVMSDGRAAPLGGTKQRAALGYLLLQANQVVPTSRLLAALWSEGEAPVTARKILQNAVWGLRGMLHDIAPAPDSPAELVTRAPGYMIRVDPDHVDLHLFRRRVRQGRGLLTAGNPHEAMVLLSEALELWRGPALADLVETGTTWPELTAVQNARLDVLEDYFEAKLRCGQHLEVLGELETSVETEPLRERSSGQLMLALYRCSRQADALSVYNRIRAALVEDLGLEPGHELRKLQQAILAHDRSLGIAPAAVVLNGPNPAGVPGGRARRREDLLGPVPVGTVDPVRRAPGTIGTDPSGRLRPARQMTERRQVSVLLVRARLTPGPHQSPAESADELLETVTSVARRRMERLGGEAAASIGSVSLGLFRSQSAEAAENAAFNAVRAAVEIRDRLMVSPRQPAPWPRLTVHAAVATGRALLRFHPHDDSVPPTVNGALLDLCQGMLAFSKAGEVQVCGATREATESVVRYGLVGGSPLIWRALEVFDTSSADPLPV